MTLPRKGTDAVSSHRSHSHNLSRLSKDLQATLTATASDQAVRDVLPLDQVHEGDAVTLLARIEPASIALSCWSPPYFVGKTYESHLTFDGWQNLLQSV